MKTILKLSLLKKVNTNLEKLKSKKIIVGIIGNNPDAPKDGGLTIRQYAELNEYGTSTIPARPFFRTATQTRKSQRLIKERIDKEVKTVIKDQKSPEQALNAIGLFIKGRIQVSLKAGWTPNKPSTQKRKRKKNGGIKPPLIDTGDLMKSIDYQIKNR
ncbi:MULTISPECIES: hypothetical protein [Fusobacterium]|jgi:phage gpG-like protein|uniref:hypothetical protein n=1 Tax=Fusobacterium TaxID=848 RepID=UPI000E825451|nr:MULTISPECIES: hypothetical protein [Fusobacterium]DAE77828.1 MAG TPA: virion morphogenesis protein [Caudoviricetes sp.]HBJ79735.1 hypothetical protein [Fusobacterium sp.]